MAKLPHNGEVSWLGGWNGRCGGWDWYVGLGALRSSSTVVEERSGRGGWRQGEVSVVWMPSESSLWLPNKPSNLELELHTNLEFELHTPERALFGCRTSPAISRLMDANRPRWVAWTTAIGDSTCVLAQFVVVGWSGAGTLSGRSEVVGARVRVGRSEWGLRKIGR